MTYYLLMGIALATATAGWVLRRRLQLAGQVMIILGCVGCAACLAWQIRQSLFTPETDGPNRADAVVSYWLANQVLSEIGDEQGTVLLLFPPEAVMDEETLGTYAGTFNRVLRGFPGLKVQAVALQVQPKAAKTGQVPLAAFQQACSNSPTALAYVSFAGVPADIDKLFASKHQPTRGFFVFDPWSTTNWLAGLKTGRVHAAVVPRPGLRHSSRDEIAGEPNELFNQLYLLATPGTADQIAAQLNSK